MVNKSKIIFFVFLIFCSCSRVNNNTYNNNEKNIRIGGEYFSAVKVKDSVNNLIKVNQIKKAHEVLNSLISSNSNNGFLYFERGYIKGYEFEFSSAISDFKTAQNFKYNKDQCQKMIYFCRKMMDKNE
jgi:hypothetical protein